MASVADDEVSVHLYAQSIARVPMRGAAVTLRQTTRFPWQGAVAIAIGTDRSVPFALRLRIPEWSPSFTVTINGETVEATLDRGYLRLSRMWSDGDHVLLSLAMPASRLHARPDLVFDLGRVALRRGPFIYCVEEEDAGGDVERLVIDRTADIGDYFVADLLGGVSVLNVAAWTVDETGWGDDLYRNTAPVQRRISARAIPYPVLGSSHLPAAWRCGCVTIPQVELWLARGQLLPASSATHQGPGTEERPGPLTLARNPIDSPTGHRASTDRDWRLQRSAAYRRSPSGSAPARKLAGEPG